MYKKTMNYIGIYLLFSTIVMGQVTVCSSSIQNTINSSNQFKKKEQLYLNFCDDISGKMNTLDEIFNGKSTVDWKTTWGGGKTGSAINITGVTKRKFIGLAQVSDWFKELEGFFIHQEGNARVAYDAKMGLDLIISEVTVSTAQDLAIKKEIKKTIKEIDELVGNGGDYSALANNIKVSANNQKKAIDSFDCSLNKYNSFAKALDDCKVEAANFTDIVVLLDEWQALTQATYDTADDLCKVYKNGANWYTNNDIFESTSNLQSWTWSTLP